MLPFIPAHPALPAALAADIAAQPGIEGVTVMGGEPFAQAEAVADLLRRVRAAGLSTMVFSGYTLAELRAGEPAWAALLAATDLLVDGRYDAAQRVTDRRWIGSANQQVHFLTERYGFLADRWPRRNTVELRLRGGEVTLNGFPIAGATRIGRKRGGEA